MLWNAARGSSAGEQVWGVRPIPIKACNGFNSAAFAYPLYGKLCRVGFKGPHDATLVNVHAIDSNREKRSRMIGFDEKLFGPTNATVSA
jgi:hypothetical protein